MFSAVERHPIGLHAPLQATEVAKENPFSSEQARGVEDQLWPMSRPAVISFGVLGVSASSRQHRDRDRESHPPPLATRKLATKVVTKAPRSQNQPRWAFPLGRQRVDPREPHPSLFLRFNLVDLCRPSEAGSDEPRSRRSQAAQCQRNRSPRNSSQVAPQQPTPCFHQREGTDSVRAADEPCFRSRCRHSVHAVAFNERRTAVTSRAGRSAARLRAAARESEHPPRGTAPEYR